METEVRDKWCMKARALQEVKKNTALCDFGNTTNAGGSCGGSCVEMCRNVSKCVENKCQHNAASSQPFPFLRPAKYWPRAAKGPTDVAF